MQVHPIDLTNTLEVKVINDASDINRIYNNSYIKAHLSNDLTESQHIISSHISYLGAYKNNELIGVFMLIEENALDMQVHAAILKPYTGSYRQLCRMCCDYVFNLGYHRITAYIADYARSMVNLTLKLGFSYEGMKRQALLKNGRLYDLHILGLLKEDRSWAAL